MGSVFSRSRLSVLLATVVLSSGLTVSIGAYATDSQSEADDPYDIAKLMRLPVNNRPRAQKPGNPPQATTSPIFVVKPDGSLASTSTWGDEIKEILDHAKGDRTGLVHIERSLSRRLEAIRKQPESEDVVALKAKKDLLGVVVSDSKGVMNRVQSAVVSSAMDPKVTTLAAVGGATPLISRKAEVVNQMPEDMFDVKVTYVRDGEGDTATIKRTVELVPKSVDTLQNSTNRAIAAVAEDSRFEPVLKEAVEAVTAQMNTFLSEDEQNVSEIDPKTLVPKVETNLAASADKMKSDLGNAEANVNTELAFAEKKRDVASSQNQDEIERLEGQRLLAAWAVTNNEEAKKLDECGMTEKAMELNSKLEFDMLDEETREKCKSLAKKEEDQNTRELLPAPSAEPAAAVANAAPTSTDAARNKMIQDVMQVVQACMTTNEASKESIGKIEDLIQPLYDAMTGYKDLQDDMQASSVITNVIGVMSSERLDADMAALDVLESLKSIYSNDREGNTKLHAEMSKLFRISGRMSGLLDEYKKRTEQRARALGEVEAQRIIALVQRANMGDANAQAELVARNQQRMPVTPQDAYKVAYDAEVKLRQDDASNVQMIRYAQAARASYAATASLYNGRKAQVESDSNAFVVGGSTPATAARRAIASSPTLRSNTNASVDNALAGTLMGSGNVPNANSSGLLRSTGSSVPAAASGGSSHLIRQQNTNTAVPARKPRGNGVLR